MVCPACGTTMNHHADKLEYADGAAAGSDWGGVVMKVHTCPGCGNVEAQRTSIDPVST
jgi:ribosomal protein S27AE